MNATVNRFPFIMKAAALTTAALTITLIVLCRIFDYRWIFAAAISFGTTCYHFSIRLVIGWIVPMLTACISPSCWWFQEHRWESSVYEALKVRHWKGKLPTYAPEQFDPRANNLHQIVRNTCNAELVHEVIIVFSFLPLTFAFWFGEFPVFLITSLASAAFDSIFVIAQRYNRPRLMRILKKRRSVDIE